MKFITAFFMAWGNFLSIPCPVRKWEDKLKKEMLKMLPSVGLVVGLLWFLLAFVLWKIKLPELISGFLMTAYIYMVTGFLHLDGFMDCRDAIMSRRSLEERQRILKDSRVGAFAVISVVFLILGMFAAITSYLTIVKERDSAYGWIYLLPFLVIPVTSRHEAGVDVLRFKPMETSQYVTLNSEEPDREGQGESQKPTSKKASAKKTKEPVAIAPLAMVIQSAIYILVPFIIGLMVSGNAYVDNLDSGDLVKTLSSREAMFLIPFNLSWACAISATFISIKVSKDQLGGMNGDIAGQGICIGELAGVMAALAGLFFTRSI